MRILTFSKKFGIDKLLKNLLNTWVWKIKKQLDWSYKFESTEDKNTILVSNIESDDTK